MSTRGQTFPELFAEALNRLADPMPHQRMGAIYTLETLAEAYPAQRSPIVEVLCTYVRSPGEPERALPRNTLSMLAAHLRPGPRFWPEQSVDLTGARLAGLDLADCRVRELVLDRAVITGPAHLERLSSAGPMMVRQATFADNVWVEHAAIGGEARFDGSSFHADAWFGGARFQAASSFAGVTFDGHAWFSRCEFDGPVEFAEAVFRRSAGFRGAVARAPVGMTGTTFLGPARVSRLGESWNIAGRGWGVVVDPDNESVGQLLWLGAMAQDRPR
jgi:hypothetical protein